MFYFLREDFDELNRQISEICEKIREIGQEMGRSCREGAETFHDNFAYEDGERQQYMWSNRLRELIRIRNNAHVATPDLQSDRVSLGRVVTIEEETTRKVQTLRIGSYMVLKGEGAISYNSPLGRFLVGAKVGEIRDGIVGGKRKVFKVLDIK